MDQYNHIKNIKICFLVSIKTLQYKLRSCLRNSFYPEYLPPKHFYVFLDSPYARSLVPTFSWFCSRYYLLNKMKVLGNYISFLSNPENVFNLHKIAHDTIIRVTIKRVPYIWSFNEVTTTAVTAAVCPFHNRMIVKIRLLFKSFVFIKIRCHSLPKSWIRLFV